MKIAIVGGGPGGYVAAIRAAQLGADVVLVLSYILVSRKILREDSGPALQ